MDAWHPIADRLERLLPSDQFRLCRMDPSRPLHEQVTNAKVIVPTTGLVDAASIMAPHDLRLIAQCASGYDNIDVEAARRRGVPVTLAPGFNAQAVAEVAVCLLLMLSRRIDQARRVFQEQRIGEPAGHSLYGKTLGIVGMGRIGRCLARAAEGLGMHVVGVTSSSPRSDLQSLLSKSDAVAICCRLTPSTVGLIGDAELSLMRPEALLINVARGAVVDKQALLAALARGHLGGVGLDVHWVEPADPSEPLYTQYGDKVLALPHLGSISQEVYDSFANILYENVTRVRAGRPLLHTLVLPGGSGTEEASQSTRSLMSEEDEGLPPVAATGAAWGQADQGS